MAAKSVVIKVGDTVIYSLDPGVEQTGTIKSIVEQDWDEWSSNRVEVTEYVNHFDEAARYAGQEHILYLADGFRWIRSEQVARRIVPGIPMYMQDEDSVLPGMYLGCFNGRPDLETQMEDWGPPGPLIGPLEHVHTTYGTDLKIAFVDAESARRYANLPGLKFMDETDGYLQTQGDCLACNNMLYGDWTVFTIKKG